jgi:hypothetical protein
MDNKKKVSRVRPKAKVIDIVTESVEPVVSTVSTNDYKSQLLAVVDAMTIDYKDQLSALEAKCVELDGQLAMANSNTEGTNNTIDQLNDRIVELETENESTVENYESRLTELKLAFQEQETENNSIFIQKINGLEVTIIELQQQNKELVEQLELTKQLLVTFQTAQLKCEEAQEEQESDAEEESEEVEVEEAEEEAEEAVEAEEVEEVEETEEVGEEVDVSKFDIVEIDDKEYYIDLDNNILDKQTLAIVGQLTEDGDAIFTEE